MLSEFRFSWAVDLHIQRIDICIENIENPTEKYNIAIPYKSLSDDDIISIARAFLHIIKKDYFVI